MRKNILNLFSELWPLTLEIRDKDPDGLWGIVFNRLKIRYPEVNWGIGYGAEGNQLLGTFKLNKKKAYLKICEDEIRLYFMKRGKGLIGITYRED